MLELSAVEARVLGALIEKDMSTPEYYPMSLNALTNACNQKSNREPVVNYSDDIVEDALETLRLKQLALVRSGAEHRVPKHAHRAQELLNLNNRELAVLCVMLLRGPQTPGELKQRTERLYHFDDLDSIETVLNHLAGREMVLQIRQPGMREPRWAHLLSGQPVIAAEPAMPAPSHGADRISQLEAEVASLRDELRDLQNQFAQFRRQFE